MITDLTSFGSFVSHEIQICRARSAMPFGWMWAFKLLFFYAVLAKMFLTCYTRDSACPTWNELLTMQANNTEYKTDVKLLNLQRSKMQFLRIRKRDSLNFNSSFILLFHLQYSNLKASFQELRNRDFSQEDITFKKYPHLV